MPSTGPHHRQSRHGPHRSLAAVVGVIPHLCEKPLLDNAGLSSEAPEPQTVTWEMDGSGYLGTKDSARGNKRLRMGGAACNIQARKGQWVTRPRPEQEPAAERKWALASDPGL